MPGRAGSDIIHVARRMEAQRIRRQLDCILASSAFSEAERAQKFLRFVVELALASRNHEIKESVIAVEVLGRTPSFDPRADPIVRVEAGRLRSRLLSYYQSEGSGDAVLIDLPKGGYVPEFRERSPKRRSTSFKSMQTALAGAVLLGSLACWTIWSYRHNKLPGFRERVVLSVLPPEGSELNNSAVSPDGRNLAFTAASGRVTRLWLRALDSLEARALPGTEQAAFPFWSPDSKSIAFFAAGMLKKIQLSGGPAQVICNVSQAPFGGTWSTLGVILFAQRPSGVIYQVSAEGGAPRAVTRLDPAGRELGHLFPVFLPDGRHFLYSAISRGPGESAIRAASLESRDSSFVLNADLGTAYARPYAEDPAGSLIFAYHGALMSQPFDTQRLKLMGVSSQIAREVRRIGSRADFSVSSNGVLAYQGNAGRERQLTWFDRKGTGLASFGPRNEYSGFALSPDEKRIAIQAEDRASGRSEIWIMDVERQSLSRIGEQAAEGFAPVWAPDGSEIVFSAETLSGMALMRQGLEALDPSPLLGLEGVKIASDWSRDGKFIAYTTSWPDFKELSIWVLPARGSGNDRGRVYSTRGHNECCMTFSPVVTGEGPRWMAYSSDETGQDEVYLKNFPAGNRKWQVSSGGGALPHWRGDGRELFYLAPQGSLMAVELLDGPNFVLTTPRALFESGIFPTSYPILPTNSYAPSVTGGRFLINSGPKRSAAESITILLPYR